jgi:hypothetical protein
MPRKHRHRTMKGGFFESLTQGATDLWEKTKKASSDAYSSATGSTTGSTSSYVPPPPPPPPTTSSSSGYMGGRMRGRKRSRKMRGGYSDNISLTGLAASASPISDIKSAQPLTTVGGRRTKRRHGGKHRHGKSCKRCKY